MHMIIASKSGRYRAYVAPMDNGARAIISERIGAMIRLDGEPILIPMPWHVCLDIVHSIMKAYE